MKNGYKRFDKDLRGYKIDRLIEVCVSASGAVYRYNGTSAHASFFQR
jgi:hypothetical protein